MKVIATRRNPSAPTPDHVDKLVSPENLETLFVESDFVVLQLPLTAKTEGVIGEKELRSMKPTAYLINTSRGNVVQEDKLIQALKEGWIAGAALDTFAQEPLPKSSPLWDMENVIITPHVAGLTPFKPSENAIITAITQFLLHLDKIGTRKAQIKNAKYCLTRLAKNCNLDDPKTIDQYVQYVKGSTSYKRLFQFYYAKFYNYMHQDQPTYKPKYVTQIASKPIHIPTEEKIKLIMANSGKMMNLKVHLSYATGLRPVEVHDLLVKDIDLDHNTVSPTTAKHGAPRTIPIKTDLAAKLLTHIITNKLQPKDHIFKGTPEHYNGAFAKARKRTARKMNDPTINTIRLYDLRHFYATMLYHKCHQILEVKQKLGHRRIENTLIYIDLESALYNSNDEYETQAVNTKEQAMKLIDVGFEYVQTIDNYHLYRKRK